MPLVSVLMTCYNREIYIRHAIDSVLNSTYTHFELIIVDDCSTDLTVSIAREYAENDSRVKVFVNDHNLGDYPNRNRAASFANGKYLKYIDSDDYIYPLGLEMLITMMERHPDAPWGICSLPQNIDKPFPIQLTPRESYTYHYFGPGLFHKGPLSVIFRRDIFNIVGGFLPGRMVSDNEMWHRLAMKYDVLLMPDGVIWGRVHPSQEIAYYDRYIPEYEKIMIRYLSSPACPMDRQLCSSVLRKRHRQNIWQLLKSILKLERNRATVYWQTIRAFNKSSHAVE